MFAAVQIPFTDVRAFLSDDTARLTLPAWPIPEPEKDFIRAFGCVRRRRQGGLTDWAGEDLFCDVRRAIRFMDGLGRPIPLGDGERAVLLRGGFRRFLADGEVTARFEVGLRLDPYRWQERAAHGQEVKVLLGIITGLPVRVFAEKREVETPLIEAGPTLATSYLRATTKFAAGAPLPHEPWWFEPRLPLVLVQYRAGRDFDALPRFATRVPVLPEHSLDLFYTRVRAGGKDVGVWLVGTRPETDRDILRRLRLQLFRLHAEQENVKWIFRLLRTGRIRVVPHTPQSERLQQFLARSVALLSRESRYGVPLSPLLTAVLSYDDAVSAGERESLLEALRQIRPNVFTRVEDLARSMDLRSGQGIPERALVNHYHYYERQIVKTQQNVNISGSTIHGSVNTLAAQTVQDSFNRVEGAQGTPPELKARLEELHDKVNAMLAQLPDDEAQKRTARLLQNLSDEALAKKPDRSLFEVSANGLMEAAKAVGEIAAPVITTVKAIATLLAF
jgi:hypothetical protein